VLAPGVHDDALTATTAAAAGFDTLYMTGFGTAAALGFPDMGLVSFTEMVDNLRRVTDATVLPVIADGDTGGNAVNVGRTVNSYEGAGAAAIHLEDQVMPKRSGFFEGKQQIPAEEHAQKIRAACDARSSEEFVVIARTDALAVGGWPDVVDRLGRHVECRAGVVFVDGVKMIEDLDQYGRLVVDRGMPALHNGFLASPSEIGARGFRIHIAAASQHTVYGHVAHHMRRLASLELNQSHRNRVRAEQILAVLGLSNVYKMQDHHAS
jgi:2,3-dimethylmalate lyase